MGRQSRIKVARRELRATGASMEKPEAWKRANAVAAPHLGRKFLKLTGRASGQEPAPEHAQEQDQAPAEASEPGLVTP